MPTEPTIRKSISLPRDLAAVIEDRATAEHRSFTKQVTKMLADFFAPAGVIHLQERGLYGTQINATDEVK